MKNAIFKQVLVILIVALTISGAIAVFSVARILEDRTKDDMITILRLLNHELDYEGSLAEQVADFHSVFSRENYRFTVIEEDGTVLADSDVKDVSTMENHAHRKEIIQAMEEGTGSIIRKSASMNETMMYVALYEKNYGNVLRISIPYNSVGNYARVLLPTILISFLLSLTVAVILIRRVSESISRPLMEISEEMSAIRTTNPLPHFRTYRYRELNIIAYTTDKMAHNTRNYIVKLEQEKQVRQEFFSNASHELKTPMTAIRGYTEMLQSGMVESEEKRQEFLARIHAEVLEMTEMINDILMISRLETREIQPKKERIRLCLVVEDTLKTLQPLAEAGQVTISYNCVPAEVYMSWKHLEEIFSNLISNAIKYNRPGGRVTVDVGKDSQGIIIRVSDTGIGISKESIGRIFERFYRVDKGHSKRVTGTGLGLSIVKHIAEYYGGFVTVYSEEGKGSSFTVQLPVSSRYNELDELEPVLNIGRVEVKEK